MSSSKVGKTTSSTCLRVLGVKEHRERKESKVKKSVLFWECESLT